MSYQAGSAFLSVKPDMSTFSDEVKEGLADLPDAMVKTGADTSEFSTEVDAAAKGLTATVTADADTARLDAELDAAAKDRTAVIDANADTTAADVQLDAAAKTRTATVKVSVDKSSLSSATSEVSEAFAELAPSPVSLAAFGGIALGPQAVGATVGVVGLGAALVAAAADAGAFGAVAVPMFTAVTTAQTALTAAQKQYAAADTTAQRTAALKAEQAALAGLTPAEQQLATELNGLTTAWAAVQKAEQPVVGAAIAPWLAAAQEAVPLVTPLITDASNAIELLGNEGKAAFADPFWGTFFSTLGTTGEIALQDFGQAVGSVGDGLAHLFVTFAPDIDKLPPLVDKAAESFDKWATGVTSGGLENFFDTTFSHANLETLKGDLGDVGSFFSNVSNATQTMSPLAFSGLSVLLQAIGLLPPDAVLALTALFLATKTIGAIGNIAGLAGSVISLGKTAAGLLGLGASTAEETAEGTAAGTAAGTSAATAFTTTFSTEVTAALPAVFTEVGATGSTEAGTAGTAMGTAAATSFGTSFGAEAGTALTAALTADDAAGTAEATAAGTLWGTGAATAFGVSFGAEDAIDTTVAFTAVGAAGAIEATAAGAAWGTAAAAGFGGAIAEISADIGTVVAGAGVLALVGAGAAGAALGAAVGLGFTTALGATGAATAVSGLETDVKNGAATASTWLQPAGVATAQGLIAGINSEAAAVQAAAAQAKTWATAGTSGSSAWLTPNGQQAGNGFAAGITAAHDAVNTAATTIKSWLLSALPSDSLGALLTPAGVAVSQGFLNGIISLSGAVISEAESLATSVENTIKSALGIASPSKVTFGLGAFTGQGFGGGLLSQVPFVEQQASQLAAASISGLSNLAQTQSLASLAAIGTPSLTTGLPGISSPLSSGPLQIQLSWSGTGDQLTDALVGGIRADVQAKAGGDVQAHLGRGSVRV